MLRQRQRLANMARLPRFFMGATAQRGFAALDHYNPSQIYISNDQLAEMIERKDFADKLTILHASKFEDMKQPHIQQRIPGSVYFQISSVSDPQSPYTLTLPTQDQRFAQCMREMDIRLNDTIVCYDNLSLASASRASWMLRTFGAKNVHILDSTFANWLKEGRDVWTGFEDGDPFIRSGSRPDGTTADFNFQVNRAKFLTLDQMKDELKDDKHSLDARPKKLYTTGHIPMSQNLPFTELLNEDNTKIKSKEELEAIFKKQGLMSDPANEDIIVSCEVGATASVLEGALRSLGNENVRLFDGSMQEWRQDLKDSQETDYSRGASYHPVPEAMGNEYREIAWGYERFGQNKIRPMWINRPVVGDYDVKYETIYCGICHSDLHHTANHFGLTKFPIVPGHELVGKVVEVGSKVKSVKVGDHVGVGVVIDSCLACPSCDAGDEQYCYGGKNVGAYNDFKRYNHLGGNPDTQTFGGYSGSNVLHEHFVVKIPEGMPLASASPLLCAGVTMFDPLKHWGATEGKKMNIGIVGMGGLGTMGVKLSKALGHHVVSICNTPEKQQISADKGADDFILSTDAEMMKANELKFDLILNTIPAPHQVSHYLELLNFNGTIVQVGLVTEPHLVNQMQLIGKRRTVAGSHICGIPNTRECLELCEREGLFPDVELITASQIDWSWDQLKSGNPNGTRYVLDIKKSLADGSFLPK